MPGPVQEISLELDSDTIYAETDRMYKELEKLHQEAARRLLMQQQQALRSQQSLIDKNIGVQKSLHQALSQTLVNLNSTVFQSLNEQSRRMKTLFKELPNNVTKQAKGLVNEYNKIVTELNDINDRMWQSGADHNKLDARKDELLKAAEEHNIKVIALMEEQGNKATQFAKFQDDIIGKYDRELKQLHEILSENTRLRDQELAHIETIDDAYEKRRRRKEEYKRFHRVERAAKDRIELAGRNLQGKGPGDISQLKGSASQLLHSVLGATGLGGIGFTLGSVVHNLSQASTDLREAAKNLSSSAATTLSARQGGELGAVRSEIFNLGQAYEASIKNGEDMVHKAFSTLAGAGLDPERGMTERITEVIGLGIESGLGSEKVAQVYDKMYRELRVPAGSLGEVFIDIRDRARDLKMPFDEYFESLSSIQEATKIYGYTMYDNMKLIDSFGYELRKGTISVQDLINVVQGPTKIGTGERAFLGTELLDKLPQSVRDAVIALGGADDPLAIAEAVKGALENSPITDYATGKTIGNFSASDAEETRDIIMSYIHELSKSNGGGVAEERLLFRDFANKFLGLNLEDMPLKTQTQVLKAFEMSGISGAIGETQKKSDQLTDAIQSGIELGEKTTSVIQGVTSGIERVYRGITEDLKQAVLSLGADTPGEELDVMQRSMHGGARVKQFIELLGGETAVRSALAGTTQISAQTFQDAAAMALVKDRVGNKAVIQRMQGLLEESGALKYGPGDKERLDQVRQATTYQMPGAPAGTGFIMRIMDYLSTTDRKIPETPTRRRLELSTPQVNIHSLNVTAESDGIGMPNFKGAGDEVVKQIEQKWIESKRKGKN